MTVLQSDRILFSDKPDWQPLIEERLQRYTIQFADPRTVDLRAFSLIVPLTVEDLLYLNGMAAQSPNLPALMPSNDCINLCNDKLRFFRFLHSDGFAHAAPPGGDRPAYPYVLKPRVGAWGIDVDVMHSAEDERRCADRINSQAYFRQVYVRGDREYTTHFITSRNQILFFRTLEFSYGTDIYIKGQGTTALNVVEVDHGCHAPLFNRILAALAYQGIGCFNYKVVDGRPLIFELNPRYGASLTGFIEAALPIYRDAVRSNTAHA